MRPSAVESTANVRIPGTRPGDQPAEILACFLPYLSANPYQRELATALGEHGVKVSPGSSLVRYCLDLLRGKPVPAILHLHWLPKFAPTLAGLLRMLNYLASLLLLRCTGRRIVWTAHNVYSHEATSKRMERFLTKSVLSLCSAVIAHSRTARELLISEFKVAKPSRIVVLPHGNYLGAYPNTLSREQARARFGFAEEEYVVLFFGNIRPYKGVPELIAAFKQLEMPSARLVIAGKPLTASTTSLIEKEIGEDKRILLHARFIPDEDIQAYMQAADVVVFPYRDILTSGALVLAMSFGRACIAPNLGSIPDMVDHRGAFLYDPDDSNGLSKAIHAGCERRNNLPAMGEYNLVRAKEWDWSGIAEKTASIYRRALKGDEGLAMGETQ
jgi:glycosyltransferase involved in cell wall biosynthesis